MTDSLKIKVEGAGELTIKLLKEVAKNWKIDDKGKKELIDSKGPAGGDGYIRNDAVSLDNLLSRFDTRQHQLRDWKDVMTLKKKLYKCYINDTDDLTLSASEVLFLRTYFTDLPQKEGKDSAFSTFDLQTLFYLKEFLEE